MRKKKPPILQYVCPALLFALAAAYQIHSAMYAFPNYFHLQAAAYPFVPDYQDLDGERVTGLCRADRFPEHREPGHSLNPLQRKLPWLSRTPS